MRGSISSLTAVFSSSNVRAWLESERNRTTLPLTFGGDLRSPSFRPQTPSFPFPSLSSSTPPSRLHDGILSRIPQHDSPSRSLWVFFSLLVRQLRRSELGRAKMGFVQARCSLFLKQIELILCVAGFFFTAEWYLFIGNPVLATGIMSFVMHEVSSFARSARS